MKFSQKFVHFINILITLIFYFFLVQMLFFAGSSSNLSLANVTWVAVVILALIIVIYMLINTDMIKKIKRSKKTKLLISIAFLITVVILQIIFVSMVHPAIGFDAGAIHQGLTNPNSSDLRGYFSQNINNLSMLLVQHWLAQSFHTTSWLFFNYVGLFLVDISIVFNIVTMILIKKENINQLIYLQGVFLLLFPWIIISYSDIWALPLVSLIIMLYACASKLRGHFIWRLLIDILLAIVLVATYYIKPSAIVPIIAIGLIEVKRIFELTFVEKKLRFKHVLSFVVIMLSMGSVGYVGFKTVKETIANQDYIQVNEDLSIPAIHFISMGVSGDGGYNPKDALAMAVLVDKQDKVDYSVKILKQRLKKMGPWGYLKFLVYKQSNNTTDGTFAWLKEGHFFANKPKVKNGWESFIYPQGSNLKNFQFLAQLFWLFLLFTLIFTKKHSDLWVQVFRISILGGLFYLLIFEGGRSRYLIQFLPSYLLLAAYVSDRAWIFINRGFRWAKGVFDA